VTEIAIKMTLEQAEVVSGLLKVIASQDKVNAGLDQTVAKAAKADTQLKRFAETVNRRERTPYEYYRAEVDQLRKALDAGLVSQEKYNAALKRAQAEYRPHDALAQAADMTKEAEAQRQAAAAAAAKSKDDRLSSMGDAIKERHVTDLERYRRKVGEVREVFAAGKIDASAYRKEVERLTGEYGKGTVSAQRHAEKLREKAKATKEAKDEDRRAADEMKRFGEETRRLNATPLEDYRQRFVELQRALKAGVIDQETFNRAVNKAGDAYRKSTVANEGMFGANALKQIGAATVAVGVFRAGIDVTVQALRLAEKARDDAFSTAKSMDESDRDLAGLSGGSTATFQNLQKERDLIAARYGIDRSESGRALFTAKSSGLSRSDAESMYEFSGVGSSATAGTLIAKSLTTFGDQVTGEQALNMAFKAAAETQSSPESLAATLPQALVSAKSAGFSFEEATALTAKLGDVFKNQEQASDRVANLFSKMAGNESLRGKGFSGIDELLKNPEAAEAFMKESNELRAAVEAITAVRSDIGKLVGTLAEEKKVSGTKQDAVTSAVAARYADPTQAALLKSRQADIAKQVSGEKSFAEIEATRQANLDRTQADMNLKNANPLERLGVFFGDKATRLFGTSAEYSEQYTDTARATFGDPRRIYEALFVGFDRTEEARTKRLEAKLDELIKKLVESPAKIESRQPPIILNNPLPKRQ
jgi:hypothetical protein